MESREKYRWMNVVAVVWVTISVVVFLLPFAPTGLPWNDDFDATTLNYAPAIVVVFLALVIWWNVSASKTYDGPVSTIDFDEGLGITDAKEEPTARA